jgi:nucleoside 2-deoxyribosyltransferase
MPEPRSIYFAGALFDAKHLSGNASLAHEIHSLSAGRFHCILPQDIQQPVAFPHAIRDTDLRALLACDAAIFNYDGLELDSGTVVEYLFAKFADIPALLLRTDFRHSGDAPDGDPWNLMNSFFPRTERLWLNSLDLYQAALRDHPASATAAAALTRRVATDVCAALDRLLALPPILPRESGPAVYDWLALMAGFDNLPAVREETARLLREKVAKRLL